MFKRHQQNTERHISEAIVEVQSLVNEEFAKCSNSPEPGSALDQCGLRDGSDIVRDYIQHGEAGLALEHLLYMLTETSVTISSSTRQHIQQAATDLGLEEKLPNHLKDR